MPIYEYQCVSCGHALEAIQKISDALLVDCPKCLKPALKKQISAAGFQLKGSGWYQTDFRGSKNGAAKAEKSESESAAKPAGGCGGNCSCH